MEISTGMIQQLSIQVRRTTCQARPELFSNLPRRRYLQFYNVKWSIFFDPRETCRACRKPWVPFSSVAITTSNESVDGLNWIFHVWELLLSTRTQGLTCCRHHVAPLITSSIDPNHHWSLKCSMCTLKTRLWTKYFQNAPETAKLIWNISIG